MGLSLFFRHIPHKLKGDAVGIPSLSILVPIGAYFAHEPHRPRALLDKEVGLLRLLRKVEKGPQKRQNGRLERRPLLGPPRIHRIHPFLLKRLDEPQILVEVPVDPDRPLERRVPVSPCDPPPEDRLKRILFSS